MTAEQTRTDQIRAREQAATKGPWGFYDGDTYANVAADLQMTGRGSYQCRQQIARLEDEDVFDDQEQQDWDNEQASEQMTANAAFIAHAREDIPFLLQRIAELETELAQAQANTQQYYTALQGVARRAGRDTEPAQDQCTAEYGGPGYTRCELATDHNGRHDSALGNLRRATWGGDADG
ncbi:hypothetical protein AB0933_32645 [Streptomyces venezuelae]|uniref:hypothetical protein n=1 Tax=Streptomyces venezuelae TaxID=54571 RepID=UPI003452DE22